MSIMPYEIKYIVFKNYLRPTAEVFNAKTLLYKPLLFCNQCVTIYQLNITV